MRDTEPPRVVVADIGTDAALYSEPGNRVLVLRPGQTFSNAVAAAQRCLPNAHPDVIRTVVRTYLPDAPDFDLPSVPPLATKPAPVATSPAPQRWFMSRAAMVGILCVATALSLSGWGLVGLGAEQPPVLAAGQAEQAPASVKSASMEPYKNEAFRDFATRGQLSCDPQENAMRASCIDWEGSVMMSEAVIGPERIVFTFSYGKQRVSLGIFGEPEEAVQFAKANQDKVGMQVEGRYALWGTDKEKVSAYKKLLVDARKAKHSTGGGTGAMVPSAEHPEQSRPATKAEFDLAEAARNLADVLPKQLGAIVMGTLGVTPEVVDRAAKYGLDEALPPAVAVAVSLALGEPPPPSSPLPGDTTGDDDIVVIVNEPLPDPKDPDPVPAPKEPKSDPPSDPAPSDPPSDPEPSDPAPPPADPEPEPEPPAPPPADPEPPTPPPSDPPPADPPPTPPSDPEPSPQPGPGTDDGKQPVPAPNEDGGGDQKGPGTDEGVPTETGETGESSTPPGDSNDAGDSGNTGTGTSTESDQTGPGPDEQGEQKKDEQKKDESEHANDPGDQGDQGGHGDEKTVPTDDDSDTQSPDEDCAKHEEHEDQGEPAETPV